MSIIYPILQSERGEASKDENVVFFKQLEKHSNRRSSQLPDQHLGIFNILVGGKYKSTYLSYSMPTGFFELDFNPLKFGSK